MYGQRNTNRTVILLRNLGRIKGLNIRNTHEFRLWQHEFSYCKQDSIERFPQKSRRINGRLYNCYNKSDCSNYRGITLLSIAGKILARVLLNRLVPAVGDHHLPESQCGFRTNRGTTDMVFVPRQLQEKCREQNKGLYVTYGRSWNVLAVPRSSSAW